MIFGIHLRLAACVAFIALGGSGHADEAPNLVNNPSFEKGAEGWSWNTFGHAKASFNLADKLSHGAGKSVRLSNSSPETPGSWGRLYQKIEGLRPGSRYRISAWVKGKGAGSAWIGGGSGAKFQKRLPMGSYDWTRVETTYATGSEETELCLMIAVCAETEGLWIDDVEMRLVRPLEKAELQLPQEWSCIQASLAAYPAMRKDLGRSPLLVISDPAFRDFKATVSFSWDAKGLDADIDVSDPTYGPVSGGEGMWRMDSVQFGIDTEPGKFSSVWSHSCYEFGFALSREGAVRHAWQFGGVLAPDWGGISCGGARTGNGYALTLHFDWLSLGLQALPSMLGVNVLVNDGQGSENRRYIEWAGGIGKSKNPSEYARMWLVGDSKELLALEEQGGRSLYEGEDSVRLRSLEYSVEGLPPRSLFFQDTLEGSKQAPATLASVEMPKLAAGSIRIMELELPAGKLVLGNHRISVSSNTSFLLEPCQAVQIDRRDLEAETQAMVAKEKSRLEEFSGLALSIDSLKKDAYIQSGIAIASRYLERARTKASDGHQGLGKGAKSLVEARRWSLLQAKESAGIIDSISARAARIQEGKIQPFAVPCPNPPLAIKDGMLWANVSDGSGGMGVRPFFFTGVMTWNRTLPDMEFFSKIGFNLLQQTQGMADANLTQSLELTARGRKVTEVLDVAERNNVWIDLMAGVNYFPAWAFKENPTVADIDRGIAPGSMKYVIDHPKAKETTEAWLQARLGMLRNKKSLLGVDISNEPVYRNSGRDQYSLPKWGAFLERRHHEIGRLNRLYGTSYLRFEDVAVPPLRRPGDVEGLEERRALFDWACFNQEHFAEWHAWLASLVKLHAPGALTHAKVMAFMCLSSSKAVDGIDPELICSTTDMAGCDAGAVFSGMPGDMNPLFESSDAYVWHMEELYYDLLHSFYGQPVINSENHFIAEGQPPESWPAMHTSCLLLQGALHHQSANILWVWDEPSGDDLFMKGSVYLRPANLYAASRIGFDLNRLALQVAALANAPCHVGLLYSVPSVFWQEDGRGDYAWMLKAVYRALCFQGQPSTFISEHQLQEGKKALPPLIIIPNATHVEDATVDALAKYAQSGGKLLLLGKNALRWNRYQEEHDLPEALKSLERLSANESLAVIETRLKEMLRVNGISAPELVDAKSGVSARGVEYRIVRFNGKTLASLANLFKMPVKLTLKIPETYGRDLLSGKDVDTSGFIMDSMETLLLELSSPE